MRGRVETGLATRTIHHGDGVSWLAQATFSAGESIVTSLPDHSELPLLGVAGWRRWFVDAAALICRSVADDAVAVFYQTDVKHDGRWIDKSFLVAEGAAGADSHLLWHKIAARVPPGQTTFGRPGYAHILCFSRHRRLAPGQSSADILPELGHMTWPRAIGAEVCTAIVDFLVAHTDCHTVVDPFCGLGSILAAANQRGLHAIGVESSRKRAAKARAL